MTAPIGHPDLLVVGAGVAGLTAALTAAVQGASVLLLTAGSLPDSASWLAQGGIAAAMGDDDTAASMALLDRLAHDGSTKEVDRAKSLLLAS